MTTLPHGVLLQIAYDGTGFSGWAAQRETRTVEEVVRGAIRALDSKAEGPRGTSRTDAGVHAEAQMAAFDTNLVLPARGWVLALNQHLPDDVAVRRARSVPAGFSPRFVNRGKRYAYHLLFDKVRDPLVRDRAWRIGYEMDTALLEREARALVGTHDFRAFRASGDSREDTVRTITAVRLERVSAREVKLVVEGNAFLYNMVRIVTGTLVDVGRGHLPEGTVVRALEGRERKLAGQTAPAQGLVLEHTALELPEGSGEPWPP